VSRVGYESVSPGSLETRRWLRVEWLGKHFGSGNLRTFRALRCGRILCFDTVEGQQDCRNDCDSNDDGEITVVDAVHLFECIYKESSAFVISVERAHITEDDQLGCGTRPW